MSRSPSSYFIDEFESLWRTEKLAVAFEFVKQNFDRFPDPTPVRIAIAKLLLRHERDVDAVEILEKAVEHYAHSGYFFRALATYTLLRDLHAGKEIPALLWQIYGQGSDYTRRSREIPAFREPSRDELIKIDLLQEPSLNEVSRDEILDSLYALSVSDYGHKPTPGLVSKLPFISKMEFESFKLFTQEVQLKVFDSTNVLNGIPKGEVAWCVGDDWFLRTEKEVRQLPSGSILGLESYYSIKNEKIVSYELISNQANLLKLPIDRIEAMEKELPEIKDDFRRLALASIIEQRLISHPLFRSIPPLRRVDVLSKLEIKSIEKGNIIGVSSTENHLGSYTYASPFFLVLAGSVVIEADEIRDRDGNAAACALAAPCIVGAFDFFLENSPIMIFRSTSNVVLVELPATDVQKLIVEFHDIGTRLAAVANRVLGELKEKSA